MKVDFPPYQPLAVANKFLGYAYRGGKPLDLLKLQKLIYCAHGWYLVFTGKPLLSEQPEAWQYGPIFRSVYEEFKRFGNDEITDPASRVVQGPFGESVLAPYDLTAGLYEENFLANIWKTYKDNSGLELSTLTHQPGSAWDQVRRQTNNREGAAIPDVLIWREFKENLDDARSRSAA